jgi:hypothetical protein
MEDRLRFRANRQLVTGIPLVMLVRTVPAVVIATVEVVAECAVEAAFLITVIAVVQAPAALVAEVLLVATTIAVVTVLQTPAFPARPYICQSWLRLLLKP